MKNIFIKILLLIFFSVCSLTYAQVNVILPTAFVQNGSEITVPIIITDVSNYNIVAFQFTLYYDINVIKIPKINTSNSLLSTNFFPVFNADTLNGRLLVAWASFQKITGSGSLLNLEVKIIGEGKSKLEFQNSFQFNSGDPNVVVVNGQIGTTGTDLENNNIPYKFNLFQNFPNPFNPTTNIRFTLPKESFVKLRVFNMLGEEVGLLVNQNLPAGIHSYDFDASNLSSGTYIYRIEADNFVSMKKMLLVK